MQKMAKIEDEMHLAKEQSKTDAEFYRVKRESEANSLLLSKEYLDLRKFEALSSNRKVYFGPDIPNVYFGNDADDAGSKVTAANINPGSNKKM